LQKPIKGKGRRLLPPLITMVSLSLTVRAYFKPGKGLRQGGPLSPLLLNLVTDVFSRMLIKEANKGCIPGLLNSLYPEGAISLVYSMQMILCSS
jgi:hypothetical protein